MKLMRKTECSSNSLFGPNLWILQKIGIWDPKKNWTNILFYIFVFNCIYFVPSQLYQLWLIRSQKYEALKNISYTFLSTMIYAKSTSMMIWQKQWKEVIGYVSDIEKEEQFEKDEAVQKIIRKYRQHAKMMTFIYWSLGLLSAIALTWAPILGAFLFPESRSRILNGTDPYPEIMSSWVPFDKTRGWGFIATFIIQAENFHIGAYIVVGFDCTVYTLMTVFAGQLKVLKVKCEKIFDNQINVKHVIRDYFRQHENLVRHCDLLNSLLSPLFFFYVTFCSVLFCATAIMVTARDLATVLKVWRSVYLLGLISQLFFYCWHSNEVYYNSVDLSYGIFSSAWWSSNTETQRNVLLLNGKLNKTILFTAGPFAKLNIITFVNIIKGSYSFFTLLRNSQ